MKKALLLLALIPLAVFTVPAVADHYTQEDAVFQVKCQYAGYNFHDAIVYPGQPNVSHRHDYFGTKAGHSDTAETLTAKTSDCAYGASSMKPEPLDHAAYWVPAIKYNGAWIDMSQTQLDAYYFLGNNHPDVEPFPYGLKIVAGDTNTPGPQSMNVIKMRCVTNHGGKLPNQSTIPDCRNTGEYDTVVIVILFPECWDGVNLDSADHRSHMAYATSSGCPFSHPVKVPKLSMTVRYLGPWQGGPGSVFAGSGNDYSAHADFFNAWDPVRQETLVDSCLNAVINCRYLDV